MGVVASVMTTVPENTLLRFEMTVEQANQVLSALGKLPYEQVYKLIEQLQQQASHQIQSIAAEGRFAGDSSL